MSFKKQDIYQALETITAPGEGKSLVENNNVKNVVIFGNEVNVDVTISNPTLQAKKKIKESNHAMIGGFQLYRVNFNCWVNVEESCGYEKPFHPNHYDGDASERQDYCSQGFRKY